jgi:hypothetical protein
VTTSQVLTGVGPLLLFVRPTERLQRVLAWEGSLIDPVGGILEPSCSTPCWRVPTGCRKTAPPAAWRQ